FSELDRFDLRDKERFHWQLLYRTVCFECFRKFVAKEYAPSMRDMDAGLTPLQQAYWQDHVTRFQIGHSLGLKDLNQFSTALEATYREGAFTSDVVYLSYVLSTKLPIAAAGVFQPDLALNGECLQVVNRFVRTSEGFAAAPLHKLCMSVLPASNATILSMSTL